MVQMSVLTPHRETRLTQAPLDHTPTTKIILDPNAYGPIHKSDLSPAEFPSPSSLLNPLPNSALGAENPTDNSTKAVGGNRLEKRIALGKNPGGENLPIRQVKRRKVENVNGRSSAGAMVSEKDDLSNPQSQEGSRQANATKPKGRKKKETQPRKTKSSDGLVNGTLKGRVKKPSAEAGSLKSNKLSSTPSKQAAAEIFDTGADWETEGLQLKEATTRRPTWTPIKDTGITPIDLTDSPDSVPRKTQPFGSLLSDFGFCNDSSVGKVPSYSLGPGGATTKQRIELVQNNLQFGDNGSISTSNSLDSDTTQKKPAKPKKPCKPKATTITSIATARYEIQDSKQEPNILENFTSPCAVKRQPENDAPKPKTSKSKPKKIARPKKSKALPEFNVAPTVDALERLENQELLFGTSSQLERDFVPSITADCEGGQISRQEAKDEQRDRSSSSDDTSFGISRFSKSRNLWGAGSRDAEGALASIEIVDLVDSPRSKTTGLSSDDQIKDTSRELEIPKSFPDKPSKVENDGVDYGEVNKPQILAKSTPVPGENARETSVLSSRKDIQTEIGNSSQTRAVSRPDAEAMPAYRGFSTAELGGKVAAFGFKPLKNREKMISLLEKCWESQHKTTNSSAPGTQRISNSLESVSNASSIQKPQDPVTIKSAAHANKGIVQLRHATADTEPAYPKAPKGKKPKSPTRISNKKKDNVSTTSARTATRNINQSVITIDSDEIEDSEEEKAPTPSKLSPKHRYTSSRALPLSSPTPHTISSRKLPTRTGPPAISDQHDLPDIFQQITRAIRAQPRMRSINGIKQPTWHEKIVMYDPICLEDLTLWLNTAGLGGIEEDREVNPSTVREWCESKGTCCSWKKSSNRK